VKRLAAAMALVWLAALAGCGETPSTAPTAQDFKAEHKRMAARTEQRKAGADSGTRASPASGAPAEETTEFGAVSAGYRYDPSDKRDPFRSYRWERLADQKDESTLGPLEQFELEQLSVTAVIWDTGKPRALVSDPSGQSYVVREGTRVGKNEGRVIHIGDNLVLVKETYVDFAGETTTKDVELRIRRSQGG